MAKMYVHMNIHAHAHLYIHILDHMMFEGPEEMRRKFTELLGYEPAILLPSGLYLPPCVRTFETVLRFGHGRHPSGRHPSSRR